MPALAMPLVGFVLGVAFAWVAADELARGPGRASASRSLLVVALFGLLVYAPAGSVLLAFGPDWSFAYLVNSQRIPTLATSALVLVDAASVPLGFALGAHLAAERRLGALVRLAALPALFGVLGSAVALPRLVVEATYTQFHGDFGARSVAGSPLGFALLWTVAVLVGAIGWTVRCLRSFGAPARKD